MMACLLATCIVTLFVLVILYFLCREDGRKRRTIKKKAKTPNEPIEFNLKNIDIPRLTGWPLKLLACILKWRCTSFLKEILCRQARKQISTLTQTRIPDPPTFLPIVPPSKKQQEHKASDLETILKKRSVTKGFSFVTITELVDAYRNGETTPLQVIENVLEAIQKSEKLEPKLRAFVEFNRADALLMAKESTKRYAENKPLSIIDGIPIGIKGEISVVGYHKRCGTTFLGSEPEEKDCNLVAKLRELGAVIIGMTNMHEIGLGTIGDNPNKFHGTARNPYNLDYHTGGSSGGSASAVAAGLCPVAIGKDGGGSIRIPASFCGLVGVKATFGRITGHAFQALGGATVSHMGPICSNVRDTAIMYALLSGRDIDYSPGLLQPEQATLEGFENFDLSDLTMGVDWSFAEFADKEMVDNFKTAVEYLKKQGAAIISIEIPELEETRVAHSIIIISEISTAIKNQYPDHMADLNPATFVVSSLCETFSAVDYIVAQKQRTRAIEFMKSIFSKVDCILTPATGCNAQKVSRESDKCGLVDGATTGVIMRYSFLANVTGVPGVVVPVGYDGNHLPVGVQVMAGWWEEHVAFRVAHCLEGFIIRQRPSLHYNILNPSKDN